jgi:hypothetical protein
MANARGKNFGPPMTLANMRQNALHADVADLEALRGISAAMALSDDP